MPLDGPKSISAKFGKTKVQTIKILQPTSDKPPLTSHTQKNHAVKQKSKLARHNKSNEAAQGAGIYQDNRDDDVIVPMRILENDQRHQELTNADFAIDENQDIGEADAAQAENDFHQQNQQPYSQNQQHIDNKYVPLCEQPTGKRASAVEMNPKNYQFVPVCWTQRIRPAGKNTFRSENLCKVMDHNANTYIQAHY